MKNLDDIACWQRIDARLTTSGRLAPADPARLADLGVRHVINLALADSPGALADEPALMAAAGLAYTHVPVPFDAPDEEHFAIFAQALADTGDEPVHVHCIMNWRVSAFVCRWNRSRGMDAQEALALMRVQWDPATSTHKDAAAWQRFVNRS
ncbi:protein tyrosine phosphatase family protein [Novosphingobium mangrovi (ex Huang et al. 2023)]|uniref:Protein tyrosine phosphatase family protein n=1 Tax=Novosphingobium mangrovi (ex Huang et al. 2023) TaxID=2976432 RepID=A0ABT2I8F5_9SPHN|nr:protein tyrosine phosphatase family protein [Novosphingobium mangrovi (ex Huang et al. 2023)]MCT2401116.1 protein tyrosine phosphatase family protein [Novosphingobium mangrovi (ex Huang et al. 2023)]